ncbi:MAG: hypothetical protein K8R23_00555 [Chthoniobacter sp.]|nr:hypothetical protein [Chthoniobacter sp.]
MSTQGSSGNLSGALKEFSMRWHETQGHWHDVKSQEFERTYLEKLPNDVGRAMNVIEEIGALLQKVRRDCE